MNINDYTGLSPEKVLKEVFGYDSFRHLQKDIISNVLAGKDTLAIMPTGGGKSLCYQIPALIFDGITVVVSPNFFNAGSGGQSCCKRCKRSFFKQYS